MVLMKPDPTFYPSARMAMEAPAEEHAYVVLLDPTFSRPDGLATVDLDEGSDTYGEIVNVLDVPEVGDELHHFGWNVCSAALCPYAPHPHLERRYLVVPGIRSSRIYILDVKEDPRRPELVKTIEPEVLKRRTGYSRPHTVHCGPDGIYISALGDEEGSGPGGVMVLDCETFEPLGAWEVDRGPQHLHYDFWWHLGHDTMVTSEWGTPNMIEDGLDPDLLMNREFGHRLHLWDLADRTHQQVLDLGDEHQMALELRPSHDPTNTFGFVNSVISVEDLSTNVFTWHRPNGEYTVDRTISVPAEPADPGQLPPALKPFEAVPPLSTDHVLSLDDQYLFVSCWGTGELKAFDVSDPLDPVETGSIRLGGIVDRTPHPARPDRPLNGGPQMVEASRDGDRLYFTNSLYASWDDQFYPDGIDSWMVRVDVGDDGSLSLAEDFFVDFTEDGRRAHQIRLDGGDASSDSYCYP